MNSRFFLLVCYTSLPPVLALLKDCYRYDGSASNNFPCDSCANVRFLLLGGNSQIYMDIYWINWVQSLLDIMGYRASYIVGYSEGNC